MSGSSEKPWSDNPYAPQIPYWLYFAEKANLAGSIIGGIFYGIVIVLFFQCMSLLLSSTYRARRGVRWGLLAYAVASFSIVTVYTAANLDLQTISFVDNREFPGTDQFPPGPLGYQYFIYSAPLAIVGNLMFLLNNWLADGLLLYRCYVIFDKKSWIIAFPCLVYLTSLAMGIMLVYQTSQPNSSIWNAVAIDFGLPYFSISLSLNILLTLLIVARLAMHSKNIRGAMGAPAGGSGLYETIITVLVESCAIYAVASLLFVAPWGANSHVAEIFLPILAEVQVIAPLLIVRRVADQRALASDSLVSGTLRFRQEGGSMGVSGTLPGDCRVISMDAYRRTSEDKVGGEVEVTFDMLQDKV